MVPSLEVGGWGEGEVKVGERVGGNIYYYATHIFSGGGAKLSNLALEMSPCPPNLPPPPINYHNHYLINPYRYSGHNVHETSQCKY